MGVVGKGSTVVSWVIGLVTNVSGSSLYQVGLVIKFVWNRVDPAWRVDEGVNVSLAV
ncbi:MAG: hypothetical protein ACRDRE_22570 [Pseudonocardiaceae bacterium]